MKILSYKLLFVLLLSFDTGLNINTALAADYLSFPRILNARQDPPFRRRFVEHKIKLQTNQSSPISAIFIKAPKGLLVGDDIIVHNMSNEKIETQAIVEGDTVQITFSQELQKDEILEIDLNDVTVKGASNTWLYKVSVKLDMYDEKFQIGVAKIGAFH